MNLVEVCICDQVFVIAYDADTTIARLAETALAEYQAAFYENVPSKVKYVQDTKKRILSGTLLVSDSSVEKSLIVELIDSGAGGARRPLKDDICGQYRMWQEYSAARAKQCLESMADSPNRVDPNENFLDMLQDLRRSRFEEVQRHTVDALSLLLDYFRNKKFGMFAMQELQLVVHESAYRDVALAALRKISTSRTVHKYIYPVSRLMKDMSRLLRQFDESVQAEFFDLHDYLENAISNMTDEGASDELRAAENNSRSPRRCSADSGALFRDLSLEADPKDSSMEREASDDASKAKPEETKADTGAAAVDRVVSLLVSEEVKNRQYAIQKAVDIVWRFAIDQSSESGTSILELKMNRFVSALLACMKASLKPSATPRSKATAEAKAAGGSTGQAKATIVASLALNSPNSDVMTVQLSLRCLGLLSICRPRAVREVLLYHHHSAGNYCKLLTTIAHAKDPFADLDTNGDNKLEILVALMKIDIPRYQAACLCCGIAGTASINQMPVAEIASLLLLLVMKDESTLYTENSFFPSNARLFNENDALEGIGFDLSTDARWASAAPDGCGIKLEAGAISQLLQTEFRGNRNSVSALLSPLRVEFSLAYLLHLCILSGSAAMNPVEKGQKLTFSRDETQPWGERPGQPSPQSSAQEELIKMFTGLDFGLCKLVWKWVSSSCRRSATLATYILGTVATNTTIRKFFLQHRSTISKVNQHMISIHQFFFLNVSL